MHWLAYNYTIWLESHTCSIAFCRFSSISESILDIHKNKISSLNFPGIFSNFSNRHNFILVSNQSVITIVTTVFSFIPCLAEIKWLPLDFLGVYVHWKQTGHFFNRPVELGRGLQETQMRNLLSNDFYWIILDLKCEVCSDSQLYMAWTWRPMGLAPRLRGGGGSHWGFQRDF